MDSVRGRKAKLRAHFRSVRRSLEPTLKKKWDVAIAENASRLLTPKGTWSIYSPYDGEVDTNALIEKIGDHVEWAYPVVQNLNMKFFIPIEAHAFEPGECRAPEPLRAKSKEALGIDVCFVPALAFDVRCHRLGSGKGFYDRFLSGFGGISVGLAYEAQLTDELPTDENDQAVDYIVTEKRVLKRA
jgi:5-formyltetrahydrofolate cyclo-ligase